MMIRPTIPMNMLSIITIMLTRIMRPTAHNKPFNFHQTIMLTGIMHMSPQL